MVDRYTKAVLTLMAAALAAIRTPGRAAKSGRPVCLRRARSALLRAGRSECAALGDDRFRRIAQALKEDPSIKTMTRSTWTAAFTPHDEGR
jgi:hypothetical protein